MQAPLFSARKNAGSTNLFYKLPYHPTIITTYHRTLSTMNTSPTEYRGPSSSGDLRQYGISHTRANNTNNVHGNSNTNVGNVSNSYNNTINVGGNEESSRIQAWLSPLEPHIRHQDVRNRRLDGVGDWVLRRNEFKSWRESQDGSQDPSLRCYGGQGVGKTYIRYKRILQNHAQC